MRQTKQEKLNAMRIERAYYARCSGMQLNIMDIGKVFKEGERLIAEGASDSLLGDGILAFVQTIRKG